MFPSSGYVALNPGRAGLVAFAAEWPWSSARVHLGLADDAFTAIAPVRDRFPDFSALLGAGEDEERTARLLKAEQIGRPVGGADFVDGLESETGRRLKPERRERKAAISALSP